MAKAVRRQDLTRDEWEQRQSILREVKRYRHELETGERPFLNGREPIKRLIEDWKELRPDMVKRLTRMGVLKEYALCCLERRDDKRMELEDAGMPPTDAREAAEWSLLLWSEEEDNEEAEEEQDEEEMLEEMLDAYPEYRTFVW